MRAFSRRQPPVIRQPTRLLPFGYVERRRWHPLVLVLIGVICLLAAGCYFMLLQATGAANPCGPLGLPFGGELGMSSGVPAYSNCHDGVVSKEFVHFFPDGELCAVEGVGGMQYTPRGEAIQHRWRIRNVTAPGCGVRTGMRWQCVEYARRFWLVRRGVVFGDVEGASNIFDLASGVAVSDQGDGAVAQGRAVPMDAFRNGGPVMPKAEDLVVYGRQKDMPYGHVAVIVDVSERAANRSLRDEAGLHRVALAEQNYRSQPWGGGSGREVVLEYSELHAGVPSFHLRDPDGYVVLGWVRLGPVPTD